MRGTARAVTVALAAAVMVAPAGAGARHLGSGRPDCRSRVRAAPAGAYPYGDVRVHGFGEGEIGFLTFPAVPGVTPAPTRSEGDVTGAFVRLELAGIFGGGTTEVEPLGGTLGESGVHRGAQVVTAASFTGHYQVVRKRMVCESVASRRFITWTYFEFRLTGLLTPTSGGSPLRDWAQAEDILVERGDAAAK